MRSLWDVSNLFVCLILSSFNAVTSVVYVENGKSLTLNPNIQGTPEDILWTYNGNKVAEHDLTEFQDYGQFRRRSEIEISTGQLTVHTMTSHDSGIYRSVIQINGKLQNSENEVKVIDAVQEPNVTCKLNKISRTLSCSVSSQFNVSYEWTGSGSAQQSGQELHISKEEKPDSVYTCTVKNEVSQKSSSFTVKDCDTDEPPSEQNIILPVILAVAAAVLVIVAAVAIYFIQQKRKKNVRRSREQREDKEGTRNSLMEMSGSSWTQEPNGTQAPRNRHVAEGNRAQHIDRDESVDNNEDRMNDNESRNDSEQRIDSEDRQENEEQEMTENMKEGEMDPLVHPDAQMKSDSEKEGHMNEEDEQETSEEQTLNGPAQVRCEEPSSRNTEIT